MQPGTGQANGFSLDPFGADERLPYRIINSELNSSVVHDSLLSSDSDTIISSSSISLPKRPKAEVGGESKRVSEMAKEEERKKRKSINFHVTSPTHQHTGAKEREKKNNNHYLKPPTAASSFPSFSPLPPPPSFSFRFAKALLPSSGNRVLQASEYLTYFSPSPNIFSSLFSSPLEEFGWSI